MRDVLFKYASHQMLERSTPQAAIKLRGLGTRFFHASASLQRRVLGEDTWRLAFTFALVRNPFARQLSMFTFLLQEAGCRAPLGRRPQHCDERRLPEAGPWLKNNTELGARFRTWIRALSAAYPPATKSQHLFGARSHGNELDTWFNSSQHSWLVDGSGQLLVHKVIKLEELRTSWGELQASICGLKAISYEQASGGSSGSRRNPSHHLHYSHYYDEPTRRIVEAYVGADLAAFGYTFEHVPSG